MGFGLAEDVLDGFVHCTNDGEPLFLCVAARYRAGAYHCGSHPRPYLESRD